MSVTPSTEVPKQDQPDSPLTLIISDKQSKTYVSNVTFWIQKYWLLVEVIPIILVAVVVRIILDSVVEKFVGYFNIGDVGVILTGGIFLIGFMMSGVITDYKEAEKLPGDIAVCIAGMEEALVCILPLKCKDNPKYTPAAIRTGCLKLLNSIFSWLGSHHEKRDDDTVFTAVGDFCGIFTPGMFEAGPPVAVRLVSETARLRQLLTRISVISHSTYLPAGYALVELFVALALILVILAKYSSTYVCYGVIVGITIVYGGMMRLMRDVDNPFEYGSITENTVAHAQSGSTEIDLAVLLDYRRTLCARIANDPGAESLIRAASVRRFHVG